MRSLTSYLRVIILVFIVFCLAEYFIDSGEQPAFIAFPEVTGFLILFAILLVAVEIIATSMHTITNALLTEEQKEAEKEKHNETLKKLMARLTKSKPIEKESEIVLDHEYDGIKELDNSLPPWWLYGFYISIVFSFIYLIRFHILGADTQLIEYEKELVEANIAIEAYKKTAKDLVSTETVEILTDASDLSKGKTIYTTNCVACHRNDGGGGIGPNLTDEYWILGGGIKNVFNTISEGGRSGKGMVAWKQILKPSEIQQVASYVLTLKGINAPDAKAPEGEVWKAEE